MKHLLLLMLVGFLVSVSAFGYGGRPHFVGPGISAANLPATAKPVFGEKDTAVTYITAAKSTGGQYNSGDRNELHMAQLHRTWAGQFYNVSVGAVGYAGTYEHANYFEPRKMGYRGGGILITPYFVGRAGKIEGHAGPHISVVYETGKLHEFLKDPNQFVNPAGSGIIRNYQYVNKRKPVLGLGYAMGLTLRPYRSSFLSTSVGLGPTGERLFYFGSISAGYGPIGCHFSFQNNAEIFKAAGKTLGLSVALPNFRRSGSSP